MQESIFILCTTFLITVIIYWIMPIKKMKEVNKALKSLLQVLPITNVFESIRSQAKTTNEN